MSAFESDDDVDLRRAAGAAFLHRLKTAGVKQRAADFIAKHGKEKLIGGAGGALAATGIDYAFNRGLAKDRKSSKKTTLREDLAEMTDKAKDVAARHPFRTALISAPIGARIGMGVAKKLSGK